MEKLDNLITELKDASTDVSEAVQTITNSSKKLQFELKTIAKKTVLPMETTKLVASCSKAALDIICQFEPVQEPVDVDTTEKRTEFVEVEYQLENATDEIENELCKLNAFVENIKKLNC